MTVAKKFGWAAGFLLILAIVLMLFLPKTNALPKFEEAVIIGDEVNMRLRPSTDSPYVLKLDKGTRIGVFCEEEDGWLRVIYGNYRGYISKDFVYLPSTDSLVGNILQDGTGVYDSASNYGNKVATLDAGSGVSITGMTAGFYKIEYEEGKEGYVDAVHIKTSTAKKPADVLKKGMSGTQINKVQRELRDRGFLSGEVTNYYGDKTEQAVKDFQKAAKLSSDGVAGAKTLELLFGDNDIYRTRAQRLGVKGEIKMADWWDTVRHEIPRGTVMTITDVKTGISFQAKRFGGTNHSDTAPLTKDDVAKMKKIYGGKWSWDRRAVWVTVGNKSYAASINGMPHSPNFIPETGFGGHFCVHFLNSKTHVGDKPCPIHQSKVKYAYDHRNDV